MSLVDTLGIQIVCKETLVDGVGLGTDSQPVSDSITFANAAGALGVTKRWGDSRVLTGTDSLDLAGGVTDRFGVVKTFTKNKLLYIKHTFATGTLTIGGGSNPWIGWFTGTIVLNPGGILLFVDPTSAGKTVTAGTGDLLQIVASVASQTYNIVVMGE